MNLRKQDTRWSGRIRRWWLKHRYDLRLLLVGAAFGAVVLGIAYGVGKFMGWAL